MITKLFNRKIFLFVTGFVVGALSFGLLAFTTIFTSPGSVATISKISAPDAQASFKRYMTGSIPLNAIFKGFSVNRDQLSSMNSLIAENPSLAGFRIYMGVDNTSTPVGIVVGIDNAGKDNTNSIYKTSSGSSGPCPTICDQTSTITAY